MYLEHFGLERYPFSLISDTEFFFDHGVFKDVLDVLDYSFSTGEGFTKVIGESGTGKTLLCRKLMSSLGKEFVTVHFDDPYLDPMTLQTALARELGIKHGQRVKQAQLLELITGRLLTLDAKQIKVVLLVDEAQSLSDDCMDALRILSNLETEKNKLLQIVLFGLPELDMRLKTRHLRQLGQRILYSCSLKRLSAETLNYYVRHRMNVAGKRGILIFEPRALALLHSATGGVPRLVNVLAHKAMLVAFGRGDRLIGDVHIRTAMADTDGVTRRPLLPGLNSILFGVLCLVPASL